MADTYILIEGGIVQNDPALPVLNLDVLTDDTPDTHTYTQVKNLRDTATQEGVEDVTHRAQTWLNQHQHLNPGTTCTNCGELIEPDDDWAIWYHTDTGAFYCDGDDQRDRSWGETDDHATPPDGTTA